MKMGLAVHCLVPSVKSIGASSDEGELIGVSKYGSSTIRQMAAATAGDGGFRDAVSSLSFIFSSTAGALWLVCTCVREVLGPSCGSRVVVKASGSVRNRCHCSWSLGNSLALKAM